MVLLMPVGAWAENGPDLYEGSVQIEPSDAPSAISSRPLFSAAAASGPEVRDSTAELVDLPRAIELALKNNPEIRMRVSEIDEAMALRDKVGGERWPALKMVGGFTEYRREQRLYPAAKPGEPAVVSRYIAGEDLVLSLPLFTGGRLSSSLRASDLAAQSARYAGERTRAEVAFRVTVLYYGILAQRHLCTALAADEAALQGHVRTLTALVEQRKAAPLDRQRVEVRLAALQQRRIQEESMLRSQTLTLWSLLSPDEHARPIRVVGELAPPPVTSRYSEDEWMQKALTRRPDYLAARTAAQAQDERVRAARAAYWPQLSLLGSYGLRQAPWPTDRPAGTDAGADVGQIGVAMDLPVFQGGRIGAAIRVEQARSTLAAERLRQVGLRIRVEVETALLDLGSAMERVTVSETALAQASEAFRVETEKNAAGRSTISEVLSAEADLAEAEANRARGVADANTALAALKLVAGEEP